MKANQFWYLLPFGQKRLIQEKRAVEMRFPQFQLRKDTKEHLFWDGILESNTGKSYRLVVIYPNDYPLTDARSHIVEPEIINTPHRWKDGHLCLFFTGDNGKSGFNPATTTAATIIAWSAQWIFAYETWKETGVWPGKSAD